MAKLTMKQVADYMADLDLCMFNTVFGRGLTAGRPMSNNGDTKYEGKSYFFTYKKTKTVRDIKKNPNVSLSFMGTKRFKKLFLSVSGKAKLIDDRATMDHHWNKDLEVWFKKGLDTPGIVMIEVQAKQITYWSGMDEGELKLK